MEMDGGGGDWTGQMIVVVVVFEKEGNLHGRGGERTRPLWCRVALASDCLTVARCRAHCDALCTVLTSPCRRSYTAA
jgi:hypothetical protein